MRPSTFLSGLALFAVVTIAHAHAHLKMSTPADASVVSVSPPSIVLKFSEAARLTAAWIQKDDGPKQKLTPLPDKPAVEDIAHKLKDAGVGPWLDKWYLVPGKTFQSGLAEALGSCPTCAVFIGPKGVGDWALEEVLVAQDRAAQPGTVILRFIAPPSAPGTTC